jgi:nitrate/nitrite-specific signal transduction histidine kinase
MRAWLLGGALLAGALVAAVAWWLARGITQPLRALQAAMQDLKAGDYEDARVKPRGSLELAQAARAFNALSEGLKLRAQGGTAVSPVASPASNPPAHKPGA